MRHTIGELLTCTRCVGTWSALALVGLRTASPASGQATATVLALAGTNDLMQSAFLLLVERTNLAIIHNETPGAQTNPPESQQPLPAKCGFDQLWQ